MDAIDIKGLQHSFKGHKALVDVGFRVPDGAIHGFVGPNGAGKTTTLKVLATLLRPDSGRVRVFGQDVVGEADAVRRRIGFMPDHFSMYRQMTVGEYLDFFAAAYGLPVKERERVIADALELTDMHVRRRDLIRGLSRGMQQRVCLARVLVHDPRLLLLDEPASGLDPRARRELMDIIRALRDMGKTIFISSHILAELAELCDSTTILDRGRVRFSGPMSELLSKGKGEELHWVLRIAEPVAGLDEVLAAVAGVQTVELDDDGRVLQVVVDRATADSAKLLGRVFEAGAHLVEFREDALRLDEVFYNLTTAGVRS